MRRCVPKHLGFEIELGNHLVDTVSDTPALDAARALVAAHHGLYAGAPHDEHDGEFDRNGFRCYLDHEHAELSSPLLPSATFLTLAMRDARRITAACKQVAEQVVGPMHVSFNNSNRQGIAWAFHANILVSRLAFNSWRHAEWLPLTTQWIPFLATSSPLFGTGKVHAENGTTDCVYQYSQRADFIDQAVGHSTTDHKNIVNERDEPLADPDQYGRLHVIAFDTTLMEFQTWLKFGVAQVMLALIEEGVAIPDLTLHDPVAATQTVSRDVSLQAKLKLRCGSLHTALDVQRRLSEAASTAVENGCAASAVPDAKLILERWIETLDDLEARRSRLCRRLDWCAKLHILQESGVLVNGNRERALVADLRYAEVGGIFEGLESAGAVDRLEDFLPWKHVENSPGRLLAREQARAVLVNRFGKNLVEVDWEYAIGRDGSGNPWFIPMDNPLGGDDLLRELVSARTWAECLRSLIRLGLADRPRTVEFRCIEYGQQEEVHRDCALPRNNEGEHHEHTQAT